MNANNQLDKEDSCGYKEDFINSSLPLHNIVANPSKLHWGNNAPRLMVGAFPCTIVYMGVHDFQTQKNAPSIDIWGVSCTFSCTSFANP